MSSPCVLLRGPAGSGKRVLAQAIHTAGCPGAPFEAVRCGAFIDDRDLERALFGSAGAVPATIGAWQKAQGGTLFLQEIADLSPPMQKRIAEALRDRQPGDAPQGLRVIATTAESLGDGDGDDQLDEDLFFRLLPMSIRVPSLAERGEDFDDVVDTAWRRAGGEGSLSGDVRGALKRRLWRGNIAD
jgi:DNA-binding NtrC family response regulator